jgi:UDP-2,3-diacylglucosamine pyrophosphatase LpxH
MKRKIEYCVISDVHLGTVGCHAKELCDYLDSIEPKNLIILGDFLDGWNFKRRYFPNSHFEVIRKVLKKIKKGTRIYYLTGNHDEFLRKFEIVEISNLTKTDSLELEIGGRKHWFFHGDVFDIAMQYRFGKMVSKLAGKGYDWLILFNKWQNSLRRRMGIREYSLSDTVKRNVKTAIKYIQDYERIACDTAHEKGFDVVVNGHIHQPNKRVHRYHDGEVLYLNSGDWVENLTALELLETESEWVIYRHKGQ